ncbi:MAG TPA: TM0106 family RecB-like putative nuclease [Candidatus Cybelea sp.]
MQRLDGRFVYSASDLNDYLECKRLTELEALVARKRMRRPDDDDERSALVRRKGDEHERRHLAGLLERYPGEVVEFERSEAGIDAYHQAQRRTLEEMRKGKRVIYQATFFDGLFVGHADFLRRVSTPSDLGAYGYEVVDTKLALAPKAYYLVQLCNYSEHLARLQGHIPEFGHVVFGDGTEDRFRISDYMAYYRHLKHAFLEFAGDPSLEHIERPRQYPHRCRHCSDCVWRRACAAQRESDDHLSLVAAMRRDQIGKFENNGIARVSELATATDEQRPTGMNPETFAKLRRQAELQVRGRESRQPIYELLEHEPPLGFALLPAPSAGDVFFDMEGDPLYEPGRALEYLFGCWLPDDERPFRAFWGTTRADEKFAFESFVEFLIERRARYPSLHVYHYANYEKSALRRLAQEHRTKENEVDVLLREGVLVDLYAVVRQSLVISEDGYGLKKLERFYDLTRETEVRKGDDSIVMFERWMLEKDRRILDDIEAYNRDDCRSTFLLREWLLGRRLEAAAAFGISFPFYEHRSSAPSLETQAEESRRGDLERRILENVLLPKSEEEYERMSDDRRARYLIGGLLAYHTREAKPQWWAYFDRCENIDDLLEFDREPIAGLRLCEHIPAKEIKRSKIYTYSFPEQHHKMGPGNAENPRARKSVAIVSIDDERNLLELRTGASIEDARTIKELIPPRPPAAKPQRDAIERIAASFLAGDLARRHPAANDLLLRRPPRLAGRARGPIQPAEVDAAGISKIAAALDGSYLFVQGPPGSGKSTYGSSVICDLLAAGKRVAVTSTSHAAIHNLLHKVESSMQERGLGFRGRYKHSSSNDGSEFRSKLRIAMIDSVDSNEPFVGDGYDLAGGTAWLLAREELEGQFDYLFIDEAGQVALADALALSLCARNVVLLGDPSQLAQVSQGRHLLHVGDSALEHLLAGDRTIPQDRGIFLDVSYRMQSDICAFVSDAMYEGRLHPSPAAAQHHVPMGDRRLAGLYFASVEHSGNSSSSVEEATEVVARVSQLAAYERDIIVVTPYNAQRRLIASKLAEAGHNYVRVGTVDKFQGQEAAVVFYSMATSSGEEMPRDMEFLFERNRFNVAISRARAASILVCSPRLLDVSCRTPAEMALVNLLCAFKERAAVADW